MSTAACYRDAYVALQQERSLVNAAYATVLLDQAALESMPVNGVPNQILDCACAMREADRYKSTRSGPGTIRDPLDVAADPDDASDEFSDGDPGENSHGDCQEKTNRLIILLTRLIIQINSRPL